MAELRDRSQLKALTGAGVPLLAPGDGGRAATSGLARPVPGPSLELAMGLIGRLVRSNRESIHIAKQLLTAQEAAEAHRLEADLAIESAAASDGDPDLIEQAVRAVAKADAVRSQEAELSGTWSKHRVEVYELISSAVRLLGSPPDPGQAP